MADIEKEKELLEKGWIKAWMLFEVQATGKEVTDKSLTEHIKKMKAEKDLYIADISESEVKEVEAPKQFADKGIQTLYAKVTEIVVLFQSYEILTNITINYAPTAIEILAPEKITITMREAQNALATVSDMMHKFTSAGLGGMVIKGD